MSCNNVLPKPSLNISDWTIALLAAAESGLVCITDSITECGKVCPVTPPPTINDLSKQCVACLNRECQDLKKIQECSLCIEQLDDPTTDFVLKHCYSDADTGLTTNEIIGIVFGIILGIVGLVGIIIFVIYFVKN